MALCIAGMICLASPGWAGLLVSRSGETEINGFSRLELEKEIITLTMEKLGWSREETEDKLAGLSEREIHNLCTALDNVKAGGEESQGKQAISVGVVILIILAGFVGIYLFTQ